MAQTTSQISGDADTGTGFLLWGWIVVSVLNLGMVIASLALFAP
jgi:hypothetical protein